MPQSPVLSLSSQGSRVTAPLDGAVHLHRTLHRRRVLLVALLVAVMASLVLAFAVPEGPFWRIQLAADVLLATYVVILIRFRNAAADREMNRRGLSG